MTVCELCGKDFKVLSAHKRRKTPCAVTGAPVTVKAAPKAEPEANLQDFQDFRQTSKQFNTSLTKEERQQQGIYFTPRKARDVLFSTLADLGVTPKVILEPSFGSGEFLFDARSKYPKAKLLGVEKNEALFNSVQCPRASLTCSDFLTWKGKADLIIGNPPYFVLKAGVDKKAYAPCMTGRPNIYVLFLYKCLEEHLEADGFLAFIIPTSLYNCSYYQPMRDYIAKHTTIRHLENLNKPGFYETGQETMLIVLQKKKGNDEYIFKSKSGNTYISPYWRELAEITKGTKTLRDLGLGVKTGNVVWNQVKENLSDDGTLLIYSSNIKDCELKLDNLGGKERKQYVTGLTKPVLDGPVILVDRGYGNSYSFNSVLVTMKNFYAENHVNVIYPKTPGAARALQRVVKSFRDERSQTFIKYFIGNGSISATDLETLMPIF
jgi:adenine-specific DNA-methyltransferase